MPVRAGLMGIPAMATTGGNILYTIQMRMLNQCRLLPILHIT
jgi:hypothetical protein